MREWTWAVVVVMMGVSGRGWAQAPLPLDSVVAPLELPEARVVAHVSNRIDSVLVCCAPPGLPSESVATAALRRFGASNLGPSLNRIPGVRLETRAPGSYRVLIRGTGRRSPFGVRDVRTYWNGLLLTEAGGDTPLNFVDLANIDEVSVAKGPHATTAGNPLGGVLALSTSPGPSVAGTGQVGSFGQRAVSGVVGFGESPAEVRLSHRAGDNYRAHSALRRQTAQVSLYGGPRTYRSDSSWEVSAATHVLATRLDYQLPGALTPELYADDPRLARPGSAEANAAVDYENVLIGTTIRARRGDWTLSAAPQLSGFRFDNPFNVNHKRETNVGLGARASVRYRSGGPTVVLGGEFQTDFRDARQYDPDGGTPGGLQYVDDVTTERMIGFVTATGFAGVLGYEVGLSVTDVDYVVERTFERGGAPSNAASDFEPFLAPTLRIYFQSFMERGTLTPYAKVSRGSSAPTLREFRTNEGSLNTTLRPEEGISGELGATWQSEKSRLVARAAAYYTRLSETITTFQDASDVQLFRNSGSAHQPGFELAASWVALRQNATALTLAPSYAHQPYRYREYAVGGESFAGRPMPGVPAHALDVLLSYERNWGTGNNPHHTLSADLNVRHESANPLNDAGTVEADAFTIIRLQVSYQKDEGEDFAFLNDVTISAGVDNLTDVRYSLGNDINPQFGNRYFQPAPGRNYFLRVGVRRR